MPVSFILQGYPALQIRGCPSGFSEPDKPGLKKGLWQRHQSIRIDFSLFFALQALALRDKNRFCRELLARFVQEFVYKALRYRTIGEGEWHVNPTSPHLPRHFAITAVCSIDLPCDMARRELYVFQTCSLNSVPKRPSGRISRTRMMMRKTRMLLRATERVDNRKVRKRYSFPAESVGFMNVRIYPHDPSLPDFCQFPRHRSWAGNQRRRRIWVSCNERFWMPQSLSAFGDPWTFPHPEHIWP